MTSVAASGTYTKSSGGFNALKANERKRSLFFYGSSVGDSCKLQLEGGGDIEGRAGQRDRLFSEAATSRHGDEASLEEQQADQDRPAGNGVAKDFLGALFVLHGVGS